MKFKNLIVFSALLISSTSMAGPPVIWDPACSSGIFNLPGNVCLSSSGGSGANTTLSNLDSPTAINRTLLPWLTGPVSLGDIDHIWEDLWAYHIRTDVIFDHSGSTAQAFNVNARIIFDGNGDTGLNANEGSLYYAPITDGGISVWYSQSILRDQAHLDALNWNSRILQKDATAKLDWNGDHVFLDQSPLSADNSTNVATTAYVQGELGTLSFANKQLSNLVGPLMINTDLTTDGSGYSIGSAGTPWSILYALTLRDQNDYVAFDIPSRQTTDVNQVVSMDANTRILYNSSLQEMLNWDLMIGKDADGYQTFEFSNNNRFLYSFGNVLRFNIASGQFYNDSGIETYNTVSNIFHSPLTSTDSAYMENRVLMYNDGTSPAYNWGQGSLYGYDGSRFIDHYLGALEIGGLPRYDWLNNRIYDTSGVESIDPGQRWLMDPSGNAIAQWMNPNEFYFNRITTLDIAGQNNATNFHFDDTGKVITTTGSTTYITPLVFTGPGLDDVTVTGPFTGTSHVDYTITVDSIDNYFTDYTSLSGGTFTVGNILKGPLSGFEGTIYEDNPGSSLTVESWNSVAIIGGETLIEYDPSGTTPTGVTANSGGSQLVADRLGWVDSNANAGAWVIGVNSPSMTEGLSLNSGALTGHTLGNTWTFFGDVSSYTGFKNDYENGFSWLGDCDNVVSGSCVQVDVVNNVTNFLSGSNYFSSKITTYDSQSTVLEGVAPILFKETTGNNTGSSTTITEKVNADGWYRVSILPNVNNTTAGSLDFSERHTDANGNTITSGTICKFDPNQKGGALIAGTNSVVIQVANGSQVQLVITAGGGASGAKYNISYTLEYIGNI